MRRQRVYVNELKGLERSALNLAINALDRAYVPYSKSKVAATIIGADNTTYTGVRVENCAYPSTQCAEAVAIGRMISTDGASKEAVRGIVIVAEKPYEGDRRLVACGGCLQMLWEFCKNDPNVRVIIVSHAPEDRTAGLYAEVWTIGELLPGAFGPESLETAEASA